MSLVLGATHLDAVQRKGTVTHLMLATQQHTPRLEAHSRCNCLQHVVLGRYVELSVWAAVAAQRYGDAACAASEGQLQALHVRVDCGLREQAAERPISEGASRACFE